MEFLNEIWQWLVAQGGIPGVAVMGAMLVLFIIQLWYYVRVYGRISSRKPAGEASCDGSLPGVSVVIPLRNPDYPFLEDTLPLLLAQDLQEFEIVLMDMADDPDFSFSLTMVAEREARIHITKLTGAPVKKMSDKMALNVGIKGAKYDNLVFTTVECRPVSDKWLLSMAQGFAGADVVIGYCGLERKSSGGAWARLECVQWSSRWLGNALRGRPYRGTIHNLGFTKEAYYSHDGFNHLNLGIGEDDLFIQKLARDRKVAVVADGLFSVRRRLWGSWYREKKLSSATFRFYPSRVKLFIGTELWSRALFFAAAAWLIITMPFEVQAAGAAFAVIRLTVAWVETGRAARRLGERGFMWLFPVSDLFTPLFEAWLSVSRSFKKHEGLWR